MAMPARGGGSGHGIDGAVLEAGVGSVGAVLAARAPEAGGGQKDVRQAAPVPSQIQPRAAWAKERLRRRGTADQTAGGTGTGVEHRAGCRAAAVANGDAAQEPVNARQGAVSEPTGESVGTGAHQVVEFGVGSAGGECAAHVKGHSGRGNRSGGFGGAGRLPITRHAGTIARRVGRLWATAWSLPTVAEDGARGVEVDGRPNPATGTGGLGATPATSGRGATSGGSTRLRSGFGHTGNRRSGPGGSGFRIGEEAVFVGGVLSGRGRERRRIEKH